MLVDDQESSGYSKEDDVKKQGTRFDQVVGGIQRHSSQTQAAVGVEYMLGDNGPHEPGENRNFIRRSDGGFSDADEGENGGDLKQEPGCQDSLFSSSNNK